MSRPGKTLAGALAAAVALAFGAYALGTQAGGGSATAKDDDDSGVQQARDVVGPPGFFGAGEVRVHFRGGPDGPGGPGGPPPPGFGAGRDPLLGHFAEKLGVKRADLAKALRELRSEVDPKQIEDDFEQSLADELGIDEGKLRDALEKVRKKQEQTMKAKRDEFAQKLADKLGISKDKIEDVLPDGPMLHRHP